MSLNVKELTDYIKEVQRAKISLEKLLDFADLMKKDDSKFEADLKAPAAKIKETFDVIESSINTLESIFNIELDKIPVNQNEIEDAAQKLALYHGNAMQLFIWSEQQRVNYKEGSYWWNYWQGISEIARKGIEKKESTLT